MCKMHALYAVDIAAMASLQTRLRSLIERPLNVVQLCSHVAGILCYALELSDGETETVAFGNLWNTLNFVDFCRLLVFFMRIVHKLSHMDCDRKFDGFKHLYFILSSSPVISSTSQLDQFSFSFLITNITAVQFDELHMTVWFQVCWMALCQMWYILMAYWIPDVASCISNGMIYWAHMWSRSTLSETHGLCIVSPAVPSQSSTVVTDCIPASSWAGNSDMRVHPLPHQAVAWAIWDSCKSEKNINEVIRPHLSIFL